MNTDITLLNSFLFSSLSLFGIVISVFTFTFFTDYFKDNRLRYPKIFLLNSFSTSNLIFSLCTYYAIAYLFLMYVLTLQLCPYSYCSLVTYFMVLEFKAVKFKE